MRIQSIALAAILALGSTVAVAQPGSGACEQHPDSPFCGGGTGGTGGDQGQAQGQAQGQNQGQRQGQEANSSSGAIGVGVGIGVGGSSRSSSGSYSTSKVGDTTSISEGSRSSSGAISGGNKVGQDVNVDASDRSIQEIEYEGDEYPVSTAASLFTQVCQQGVSGQGADWGASAVFSDPLCDEIKVAQFYWIAHINEHTHGNEEQAAEFKEMYVAQMDDIQKMMDATDELGILDRMAGFLIKPLGVIGLLVFLL